MAAAASRQTIANEGQCRSLLEHLQKTEGITAIDALRRYGIMRLGARIYDLRKHGFHIMQRMVRAEKGDGTKAYVAHYSLLKAAER